MAYDIGFKDIRISKSFFVANNHFFSYNDKNKKFKREKIYV